MHVISLSIVAGIPIAGIPARDNFCAPLNVPSPPTVTIASKPKYLQVLTAFCKPSSVINSKHLAVYKIVPPFLEIPSTDLASSSITSPFISPLYPRRTPRQVIPFAVADLTTARTTAFIPGASPPLVRIPILLIFLSTIKSSIKIYFPYFIITLFSPSSSLNFERTSLSDETYKFLLKEIVFASSVV